MQFWHPTGKVAHDWFTRARQAALANISSQSIVSRLLLHPDKTKIAYCKDGKRRREYPVTSFTFCGYESRSREAFDKTRKERYTNFLPAPSPEKITEMGRRVSSWKIPGART